MASKDMRPILEGWPYEPGRITVRKIVGRDSTIKIQVRVDLGVLQMEPAGRPDGKRPFARESLLHVHLERLRRYADRNGTRLGFFLTPAECRELREEAALYYQRYLALFVLEDYDGVIRDTARNLRVVDLCKHYATEEHDQLILEQFRPYLLMMNTRARVHRALNADEPSDARRCLEQGLSMIRRFFEESGRPEAFHRSPEAQVLMDLENKILRRLPPDPVSELRRRLHRAVDAERYEDAARLRDEIERLRGRTRDDPPLHSPHRKVNRD